MNQQNNVNRFLEFNNGVILDLSTVIMVDIVCGDPNWLRYTVSLSTGTKIEIYEKRDGDLYLPREKFIEAMKKYYGLNWVQKVI